MFRKICNACEKAKTRQVVVKRLRYDVFIKRALQQAYPLIIIDGKPTEENIVWLQKRSQHYQRNFYGFNCAEYHHHDPLAHGGLPHLRGQINHVELS